MATTSSSARGIIPNHVRLDWRLPYGDTPSVLRVAQAEYHAGRLSNAWAAYQTILAHWMRERWIEHCGRPGTTIFEPAQLCEKLRSATVFDQQLMHMVRPLCYTPSDLMHIHVDVAEGIVGALTEEGGMR